VSVPVAWHFFDRKTFELGRQRVSLEAGTEIGIYSPERCIVDAFRMKGSIGPDLGRDSVRAWLRGRASQPVALLTMARSFLGASRPYAGSGAAPMSQRPTKATPAIC